MSLKKNVCSIAAAALAAGKPGSAGSAAETSSASEETAALPSSFDLRNVDTDGDGTGDRCYVTSVRSQRPLGDCWAFAVTAAAETSLLGSVLEDDPEAYKTLDLSEKQLAYFASTAIDDPGHSQNGEGRRVVQINDAHDIYDEGDTLLPASVYAADTAVTYRIYLLEPGFTSPEDGKPAAEGEVLCEYTGFHTAALNEQIPVEAGQAFSVVMIYRMADGSTAYAVSFNPGKEAPNVKEGIFTRYGTAVVNQGESYVYRAGSWSDLAAEEGLNALFGDPDTLREIKEFDYQIDHFCIKVNGIARQ